MNIVHIVSGEPHNGTYFTCGTQHMAFEESNCFDCLNYRSVDNKIPLCKSKSSDGEGGFGCAIMDMFLLYQDEMTENMRQTLIKDYECPMRLTEKQAKLRQSEVYKRIEQENAQLRKGMLQTKLFEGGEQ
mgnify:CR=1 FL=1